MPEHLSWSSHSLHISEDLGEAILELLTQSCCFFSRSHSPCCCGCNTLSGKRCSCQDEHQTVDRHIHLGGLGRFIAITRERLQLLHFYLAEPDHAPKRDPRWHSRMCLSCNTLPGGLQGGPPVSALSLLLAPEGGGQGEEGAGPAVQRGVHTGPQSPKSPTKPVSTPGSSSRPPTCLLHQLFIIP